MRLLFDSFSGRKGLLFGWSAAFALSLLAIAGTYYIPALHRIPAIFPFFAVALTALAGEATPVLAATLIGSISVYWFLVANGHSWLSPVALFGTSAFALASLIVAYLAHHRSRALSQLQASERHYRSMAEAASDVVISIDSKSNVLSINPAVKTIFGFEPEELIGKPMFVLMPERLRAAHAAGIARFIATGIRHIPWSGVALTGLRKSGEEFPIEISFGTYTSEGQQLFTGFIRDTSERHAAHAILMKSEKLAAIGRLASSIAHEINNPLAAITNLLYLARGSQDPAQVAEYLDMADAELRRVAVIANRTLQFHRHATTPEAVTSKELIGGSLDLYQGRLAISHIAVEERYRTQKPLVCIEGDIRQVLNNLIGNSIDALPNGGRILLRSRDATDLKSGRRGWVITVADTGIGMDCETTKQIFEPFFSTKGKGGSGLGLWISYQLVEQNEGKLRVRSSRKNSRSGTVFTLFLPHLAAL